MLALQTDKASDNENFKKTLLLWLPNQAVFLWLDESEIIKNEDKVFSGLYKIAELFWKALNIIKNVVHFDFGGRVNERYLKNPKQMNQ